MASLDTDHAGVWRGIAIAATVVALAALVIVYQREVGTSLIWLGETLTGKMKASSVVPDKQPPATRQAVDSQKGTETATPPLAPDKSVSSLPDDSALPSDKDLAAPAGRHPAGWRHARHRRTTTVGSGARRGATQDRSQLQRR